MDGINGDDRAKANGFAGEPGEREAGGEAETEAGGKGRQSPPLHPEIEWGPQPDGTFLFSDHPTAEEFRAYAEWDPNIQEEVREKFLDLARDRARDDAIRRVYDRVQPAPPDLPRQPQPRTPGELSHALTRFVCDAQEAADYLLTFGRNRHIDVGARILALTAVTRTGSAAAQLGAAIDRLWRAAGVPRRTGARRTRK